MSRWPWSRQASAVLITALLAIVVVACGSSGNSAFGDGPSAVGADSGSAGPQFGAQSDGGTGTGSTDCKPRTCADQGIECGPAGDGCGGLITDCGKCGSGLRCGGPNALSKCVAPSIGTGCVPKSCSDLGVGCGPAGDGCGGVLDCGSCKTGQQCGAVGSPSVCVDTTWTSPDGGACLKKTIADYNTDNKDCGTQSDGCGGTIDLGGCTAPQFCGGGGPSKCAVSGGGPCAPKSCTDYPNTCGPQPDGCGGITSDCGGCTFPEVCGGGGTPSQCGGGSVTGPGGGACTPRTTCNPKECGLVADGCGGILDCSGTVCTNGDVCGAVTPNVCGQPVCVPLTTCPAGMNCGVVANGCGGTVTCGPSTCATPGQLCGGGGQANVCGGGFVQGPGGGPCVPAQTCADTGKQCGPVADGCGGLVQCPDCASPLSCGANGQPSICGGAEQCTPRTIADCTALGFNCGLIADGCGGTIGCGSCTTGTCGLTLPNVCSGTSGGGGSTGDVTVVKGNVPANPSTVFDTTTHTVVTNDPTNNPTLLYPVNNTMFPQNIYRVLFQWHPHTLKLFQLSFTSSKLNMNVYTDGVHATCTQAANGGSCWESSQDDWTQLAGRNAGQAVTLKIRGMTSATATTIYESPAYTINFSSQSVRGAIYYWSTTAQGIRRGALGDAAPSDYLTQANAGNCAACHTLSRDGKKMAATFAGGLSVFNVASGTVPPPPTFGPTATPKTNYSVAWSTFDPTDSMLVDAVNGVLTLRDANTGAALSVTEPNGTTSATGVILAGIKDSANKQETGIQPDWSPDGAHVVYARGTNQDRGGGPSIARMTVSGTAFSSITDIVKASDVGTTLLGYPIHNPTSSWIAFVAGPKIESDLADQIYVAPAGGGTAQLLTKANTLVNDYAAPSPAKAPTGMCPNTNLTQCIENNMPTWAPTGEPGLQWIAFASQRDYGFVLKNGSKVGSRLQQLWVAAVATGSLGSGDASYPAFRIPFVQLTENAHRPFWAEDALNTQACVPVSCSAYPAGTCGQQSDGCGGLTPNCLTCPTGQTCGGAGVANQCGSSGVCTAKKCSDLGAECGTVPDGCGGTVTCGPCTTGTCGGGGIAYKCGTVNCKALTCSQQGIECGQTGDGCGSVLTCPACTTGTCGGGGVANTCGFPQCTPSKTCPAGKDCGDMPDGCGGTIHCGTCASGQTCGGGGAANVCGAASCSPKSCSDQGGQCGTMSDQCSGVATCGTCADSQYCNGQSLCVGFTCAPKQCADVGVECGPTADGCGGLQDCGQCPAGEGCGAGGVAGKCGKNTCIPKSCTDLGAACGQVADGCGGLTPDCGACSGALSCKNGACVAACTPRTCQSVNAQCGSIADGCGGLVDCGPCPPGEDCGFNNQPNTCGSSGPK